MFNFFFNNTQVKAVSYLKIQYKHIPLNINLIHYLGFYIYYNIRNILVIESILF